MYKIGELSRISQIPVKTLRYYDSEGILSPDYIDEMTGYRYYHASKLSDCYRIISYKELGFSLNQIRSLLNTSKTGVEEQLRSKEEELECLLQQTQSRLQVLRKLNQTLKEDAMMYEVVVRKCDEITLAYERSLMDDMTMCDELVQKLRSKLPADKTGERVVLIDYDHEYTEGIHDVGIGVELLGKLSSRSGVTELKVPAWDLAASVVCKEDSQQEALKALMKYIAENDYQITGPTYRIFYTDRTLEIKIPVAKLGSFHAEYEENLNIPFEDDPEVVGHWVMVDCVPCKEMFHVHKQKKENQESLIKELYFLPGGERYWCFGWTKGYLLSEYGYPKRKNKNAYHIETIGNESYLFIEFKSYNYYLGGKPEIWVLKKLDSKKHTKYDIMVKDEIPNLPADDLAVLGEWKVCDFVKTVDEFDPLKQANMIPYQKLVWRKVEFLPEGRINNTFLGQDGTEEATNGDLNWHWIQNYVIYEPKATVSEYQIRTLNEKEYLFIQWKSGDYSFGKKTPYWYVFIK